jgi:hypothetical protein
MRITTGSTDRYIYFVAVDATDMKTRETGLDTFTVWRSRNGLAAVVMTTPTINETNATYMPGVYELLLDEDTTLAAGNDTEEMVFHITQASMAPVTRVVELYRPVLDAALAGHAGAGTAGAALGEIGTAGAGLTVLAQASALATVATAAGIHHAATSATLATIDGEVGDILQDTTSLVADHGDNTLLLQTTIDNYASVTNFTIADGSTHDDLYVGCMIIIRDNGTATNKAVGLISDYDGSTKNVTLAATPPGSTNWTMGNGDHVVIVAAPEVVCSTVAGQISNSVWTASVHPGSTGTGLKLSDIHSALPVLPTKNRALDKFPFLLVSDIDHVSPKTGAIITPTRSIDGGAFAACANAGSGLAEVSNGVYTIDLAASDTNGSSIVLRFTATGADDRVIVFVTQPSTA